jgi:hypothetical protein
MVHFVDVGERRCLQTDLNTVSWIVSTMTLAKLSKNYSDRQMMIG